MSEAVDRGSITEMQRLQVRLEVFEYALCYALQRLGGSFVVRPGEPIPEGASVDFVSHDDSGITVRLVVGVASEA